MYNASDERGINFVRKTIQKWLRTSIQSFVSEERTPCRNLRFVVLDEADSMTDEAMSALRTLIEASVDVARFVFIVNRVDKISAPIKSRCTLFHCPPPPREDIVRRIRHIMENEGMGHLGEKDIETLLDVAGNNMREIVNLLSQCKDRTVGAMLRTLGIPTSRGMLVHVQRMAAMHTVQEKVTHMQRKGLQIAPLEKWAIFMYDMAKRLLDGGAMSLGAFVEFTRSMTRIKDAINDGASVDLQLPCFCVMAAGVMSRMKHDSEEYSKVRL